MQTKWLIQRAYHNSAGYMMDTSNLIVLQWKLVEIMAGSIFQGACHIVNT